MQTQTLEQINTLPALIPDRRQLALAMDNAQLAYGKAALLVADAWALFDIAVDEGETTEVRNELAEVAEHAEVFVSNCQHELDEIKAAIVAGSN